MLVNVTVDRPLGSCHPKYPRLIYPINYGYVEGMMGGDGDWQDVYILGVNQPLNSFIGEVIAIVHRQNDNETKWIVVPQGIRFTKEEIQKEIYFQERYFESEVEML